MCGICGHLASDPGAPARVGVVRAMAAAQAHRGPDSQGVVPSGPIALGHRRLSIIDLSPEGNQPMANEDGTVLAVVNGEIYNFQELRRELEARGHRFRSRSDSEVVVHLYEERGEELVPALRGMFALAVWDARRRKLLLARDRAGEKPLYYTQARDGFAFASELPALLAGLPEDPEPDLTTIDRYLTLQYVPSPLSAFRGVAKLEPGHLLTVEPGASPKVRPYFHLSFAPRPGAPRGEADAAEELTPLLEEAVRIRMVADVPLGAFLSGGVDSSLVVALMARASSRPVKTFSIDFPGTSNSEVAYARLVAERWKTDHHELVVQPDMVSILPELVRRYGEPFGDTSAVPVYYLAKMTREHVVVALSGDGGDETFGGYRRYLWDQLARAAGELGAAGRAIVKGVLTRLPGPRAHAIRAFAAKLELPMAERYLSLIAHFAPADKEAIVGPAIRSTRTGDVDPVLAAFAQLLVSSDARDDVNRLLDLDTRTYLPDDILTKVDIATMAHALEARAPFVDHVLMQWMAGLPGELKLRGLRGKRLLRRVARGLVPDVILSRKKKGFSLPVDGWFRRELRGFARDVLLGSRSRARGVLDPGGVTRLLDAQDAGVDHGERLWNLLVLELWFQELEQRRASVRAAGLEEVAA